MNNKLAFTECCGLTTFSFANSMPVPTAAEERWNKNKNNSKDIINPNYKPPTHVQMSMWKENAEKRMAYSKRR